MYVLITERVVKTNTGSTEKFSPRTANHRIFTVSGPFKSRKIVEQTMSAALGTHTCLSAEIYSAETIDQAKSTDRYGSTTAFDACVAKAKKMLMPIIKS